MVNIHGLVKGEDIEFGRDADTGGQTRYVIDLVRHLSKIPEIDRIDLATRLIRDKRVSGAYSVPEEKLTEKASIIRLACGGRNYIPKEKLWPYLDEYTDKLIEYIRKLDRIPDFVHGHYADAGYVAAQISSVFGIPFVFSTHSLGRNKLEFLKSSGMSEEQADRRYSIGTRIRNEEKVLSRADLVIASTEYERDRLYGMYQNKDRCEYAIIPPGLDLDKFFPYYDYEIPGKEIEEVQRQAHHRMVQELKRFHFESEKPLILTLCRPDSRKNIDLLIDVYGQDKELQAMANLAVFAGIRDNIAEMEETERQVLTDILLQMDQYDLYGKMAVPKNHDPSTDVPELYRIAALKKGVFVSTSYLETFGLTFIESSASGLPFVATREGGPADIVENCKSGELVDISDREGIASAIKKILTDQVVWHELSTNGVNNTREVYTWESHCQKYLGKLKSIRINKPDDLYYVETGYKAVGKRLSSIGSLLITDIDDTLLGDDESVARLASYISERRDVMGFGVATGRDIYSTRKVLEDYGLRRPDIIISSVGSEIYYSSLDRFDKGWENHIKKDWKPEKIYSVLDKIDYLERQTEPETQRKYKISYRFTDGYPGENSIPHIHEMLSRSRLNYNLIFSHGNLLDLLPYRAGKGKAIRYLSNKWNISPDHIVTAGNSGNDADMLTGLLRGIVVGNYSPELERLRKSSWVYFASGHFSEGILEGLKHYGF